MAHKPKTIAPKQRREPEMDRAGAADQVQAPTSIQQRSLLLPPSRRDPSMDDPNEDSDNRSSRTPEDEDEDEEDSPSIGGGGSPRTVGEEAVHETSEWLEPARDDGLTLFDIHRRPRPFVVGPNGGSDGNSTAPRSTTTVTMRRPIQLVRSEFRCAICLETIRDARTVMECLHRFCAGCLEESIRKNYKHCPVCRSFIPNRRCLAPDPNFDALVRMLLGPPATTTTPPPPPPAGAASTTDGDSSQAGAGSVSASARTSPSDMEEMISEEAPTAGLPGGEGVGVDAEAYTLQHAIHHKRLHQIHQGRAAGTAAAVRDLAEDAGAGSRLQDHPHLQSASSLPGSRSAPAGRLVTIELHRYRDETKLPDLRLPHLRVSERAHVRVIETFLKHKLGLVQAAAAGKAGQAPEPNLLLYLSAVGRKKRKLTDTSEEPMLHLTEKKKDALTLKDAQDRYRVKGTLKMYYKSAKS